MLFKLVLSLEVAYNANAVMISILNAFLVPSYRTLNTILPYECGRMCVQYALNHYLAAMQHQVKVRAKQYSHPSVRTRSIYHVSRQIYDMVA